MSENDQDGANETRELYAEVEFGIEVERFIESRVGQYLIAQAEAEREEAMSALRDADPFDSNTIRKLQDTIRRAESVQIWMAEAIQKGLNAQKILEEVDR